MQAVDGAYLYNLAKKITPLDTLSEKSSYSDVYYPLLVAVQAVTQFVEHSIYRPVIRTTWHAGHALLAVLNPVITRINEAEDFAGSSLTVWEAAAIKDAVNRFEIIMSAEMQMLSQYIVNPKGNFDTNGLIHFGENIFPEALGRKVPAALADVRAAARCLAFELWTAAGFHLHRANEAVLREYFDAVAGKAHRPKIRTMSSMVRKMTERNVGNPHILATLSSVIEFHRNPLIHPGDALEKADDAIDLYSAIRAAMGYMLEALPEPIILPAIVMQA